LAPPRPSGAKPRLYHALSSYYSMIFGGLLACNPMARIMIPKRLEAIRRRLLERAARNPDLAGIYEARAAVFAGRVHAFDPAAVV
jgi:hypothetical protein